jgi:hypothetical protein
MSGMRGRATVLLAALLGKIKKVFAIDWMIPFQLENNEII